MSVFTVFTTTPLAETIIVSCLKYYKNLWMQVPWCGDMGQSSLVIEGGFMKKNICKPNEGFIQRQQGSV